MSRPRKQARASETLVVFMALTLMMTAVLIVMGMSKRLQDSRGGVAPILLGDWQIDRPTLSPWTSLTSGRRG